MNEAEVPPKTAAEVPPKKQRWHKHPTPFQTRLYNTVTEELLFAQDLLSGALLCFTPPVLVQSPSSQPERKH